MSLVIEQSKFLDDIEMLRKYAKGIGFISTGGELWRPIEVEQLYVQQGKSVTMNSMHIKRCAIDLNFFKMIDGMPVFSENKEVLQDIGSYWESLDKKNQWGGNWKTFQDCGHFQRTV